MTTVYIAMVNDRHEDPEPHPFTTAQAAIDFARRTAHERCHGAHDQVDEHATDGWLYHATYCVEGDSVWVIAKTLNDPERENQ